MLLYYTKQISMWSAVCSKLLSNPLNWWMTIATICKQNNVSIWYRLEVTVKKSKSKCNMQWKFPNTESSKRIVKYTSNYAQSKLNRKIISWYKIIIKLTSDNPWAEPRSPKLDAENQWQASTSYLLFYLFILYYFINILVNLLWV